ncbi:glutathione S-transferase [Aspergillus recurvatus]
MASKLLPIKVWGKGGPNPPRVAIILAELSLPHEFMPIELSQVKEAEYLAINPNGRLPAIHDPNTNLTLWESGAIVEYLVEQYDTTHKISFPRGSPESQLARQWLFFQASGQGPYYGQACWFKKYHPERIPSALERYVNEMRRVSGVVNAFLEKQEVKAGEDGPWLVGGRCSFADLAWVSWQITLTKIITKEDGYDVADFPAVKDWLDRMMRREGVGKAMAEIMPPRS